MSDPIAEAHERMARRREARQARAEERMPAPGPPADEPDLRDGPAVVQTPDRFVVGVEDSPFAIDRGVFDQVVSLLHLRRPEQVVAVVLDRDLQVTAVRRRQDVRTGPDGNPEPFERLDRTVEKYFTREDR